MHPNGQIPAYEWAFGDVNPPVHAWAALRVFEIDGGRDYDFLARVLAQAAAQLHLVGQPQGRRAATTSSRAASSAWTTSARSTGPRRCRSAGVLEQSDGTALDGDVRAQPARDGARAGRARPRLRGHRHEVLRALRLHRRRRVRAGPVGRARTASSTTSCASPTARRMPLRVRSVVGLLPLCATTTLGTRDAARACREFAARLRWFLDQPARVRATVVGARRTSATAPSGRLLSMVGAGRSCVRILARDARRGGVPVPVRPAGAVAARTCDAAVRRSTLGGSDVHGRLRAGRVDDRPVRRQLQLARARSGSRSTTCSSRRCAGSPRSSATTCWSSTRPARARSCTLARGRRRPVAAGWSRCSSTTRDGRRPVFGGVRAVPDRPATGATCCRSTSTSTATPAPGWAPATRPAGPAWSPT